MKLENYIYNLVSLQKNGNGEWLAEVELNAECSVYQGHFPGMPITPGVILLAMTGEIAEKIVGSECRLVNVKNLRFLKILTPEEARISFVVHSLEREEGLFKLKASIVKGDVLFAKISASYSSVD